MKAEADSSQFICDRQRSMKCRHCKSSLKHIFLDLGFAPPSNALLNQDDLSKPELYLPLRVRICNNCWLAQTEDYTSPSSLFSDSYPYLSSTSLSWLAHTASYADQITKQCSLSAESLVIEIASNDGYLLRHFVDKGIPCLGIEPTKSTAEVAIKQGIKVVQEFFNTQLAYKLVAGGSKADLIVGNNVYAHVPDINDFTKAMKLLLKPYGVITLEFPHLLNLIYKCQFDTVYHEHFSYLSLTAVCNIFDSAGLKVWKVEKLETHGGSLRIYGCCSGDERATELSVEDILEEEKSAGLTSLGKYSEFQAKVDSIKNELLVFLIEQKRLNKKVVGYGAAAKGSTLLNYAGIKKDLISFVCDLSQAKVGKFLPGSHLPIQPTSYLPIYKPDFVLVLPWNLREEVLAQNIELMRLGTRFVFAVPMLEIIN
jgi:SAM-dependent methyltransferase